MYLLNLKSLNSIYSHILNKMYIIQYHLIKDKVLKTLCHQVFIFIY